ncbi:hypothetical protein BDW62DRAFT_174024 [Aspergillus aurantiobrunneus]
MGLLRQLLPRLPEGIHKRKRANRLQVCSFAHTTSRTSNAKAKDLRKVIHESGQVYTETESTPAVSLHNGPAWVHESPYMPIGWEEGSSFEAPPLRHLAMRKLLSDQRNLSHSLFVDVPWHIASDLWCCLARCKRQSLHMWKLLATVYPAEFSEVEKYRSMKIEGPKLPMRDYLGLTKSDTLSWRVILTLAASYARVPELVEISEIKNLVALDIATPAQPHALPETDIQITALSDRIVRAWSEVAQAAGAFSHLRVLILRHQSALSDVTLHYLKAFPNLQSVIVFECSGITSAFSKGDVDGWAIAETEQSAPGSLYGLYEASCKAFDSEDSTPAQTPILDFQIGQMRSKARGRHPHSAMHLRRTADAPKRVEPEPNTRKRKEVGASDSRREQSQPRKGKAVMKDRTKDIGDMLSDFF